MVMQEMLPLPGARVKEQEYLSFASAVEHAQVYEGRLVVGCRRGEGGDLAWCVLFPAYNYGTGKVDGSWSPWLQMGDDGEDQVVTFSSLEEARAGIDRYDALLTMVKMRAAQQGAPHLAVEYDEETLEDEDFGGSGDTAYVPLELARLCGMRAAFWHTTGTSAIHIIHFSPDEWVTSEGQELEDVEDGAGQEA